MNDDCRHRTYSDNRLLSELLGANDRHVAKVEQELNVQIACRGNTLQIQGDEDNRCAACAVLDELYAQLQRGLPVSMADVEGVVRIKRSPEPEVTQADGGKMQIRTPKRLVLTRSPTQSTYIQALQDPTQELVFGVGPAGTGKTYLAVAKAVSMLEQRKVERIILSRPAVEAGERLGFLPGDLREKIDPYLRPLYDALYDTMPGERVAKDIADGVIEVAPLAFMRGRTLPNAFVILDEAQNTTPMQMKMFLTRLGEGSRMVITGDRSQVDLPRGVTSGLADAERLLHSIEKISFNYFTSKDVVRHPLVAAIIDAYEAHTPR